MDEPQPAPPSLLGLGPAWTRIGKLVLVFALASLVLGLFVHPFLPIVPGKPAPVDYRPLGGPDGGVYVNATPFGVASVFLLVFSSLASFVWTLVDVVDRRKRFVWLLPMLICPLIQGAHALPLALYVFFARETVGHSEGVQ